LIERTEAMSVAAARIDIVDKASQESFLASDASAY